MTLREKYMAKPILSTTIFGLLGFCTASILSKGFPSVAICVVGSSKQWQMVSSWLTHYPFLKHLGIYAYRKDVLRQVTQLPQSSLEIAESLEQLRWLQNGFKIKVGTTDVETVGIDTPQDLERAEEFLKTQLL
jgi:hypothetical protein